MDTFASPQRSKDASVLEQKARQSEEKREQIMTQANKDIDTFYAQRRETIEKSKNSRRQEEKEFLETRTKLEKSDNPWGLVATLINFKSATGTRDNSRMRKIILDETERKRASKSN